MIRSSSRSRAADSSSESSRSIFPIRARPAPNLGPRLGESVKNWKVCKRCQTASKVPRNGGNRHLGLDFDDFDTLERNRPNFCDHTPRAPQASVEHSVVRSEMPAPARSRQPWALVKAPVYFFRSASVTQCARQIEDVASRLNRSLSFDKALRPGYHVPGIGVGRTMHLFKACDSLREN